MSSEIPKKINKDDVYVGFDIKNQRRIIYKENSDSFYDLERLEKLYQGYLFDGTMVNYKRLAKYDDKVTRRQVVKEFKKDKKELPDDDYVGIFEIFIADTEEFRKILNINGYDYFSIQNENKLFEKHKLKNGQYEYVDMISHDKYKMINEGLYVSGTEYLKEDCMMYYNSIVPTSIYDLDLKRKEIISNYKKVFGMSAYTKINKIHNFQKKLK